MVITGVQIKVRKYNEELNTYVEEWVDLTKLLDLIELLKWTGFKPDFRRVSEFSATFKEDEIKWKFKEFPKLKLEVES